jgi:hypothetical protein
MKFIIAFTRLIKDLRTYKNSRLISYIAFILLVLIGESHAQDFDLIGVAYFNYPKANIKNTPSDDKASAQEFEVFAHYPININENILIINGMIYSFVETIAYDSPLFETTENRKKLHNISYSIILLFDFGNNWKITLNLKPTLSSDFEEKISSTDFLIQGAALASKEFNDHFTLGGGLVFTSQYGVPTLLPSLQLNYKTGNHDISSLLPMRINYLYHFEGFSQLRFGCRIAINGAYYNVTAKDFINIQAEEIDKIIYSRINIGPVFNYRISSIIQLDLFGGYSFQRKYQLADFCENEYKFDLENGPFFKIGLSVVPQRTEK